MTPTKLKAINESLTALYKTATESITRAEFVDSFKAVVQNVLNLEKALISRIDAKLATIRDGKDGRDGRDGKDGKDGAPGPMGPEGAPGLSITGPQGAPGRDGVDGSPDTADDIRNKLELLQGDDRLDKSAIRGIEKIEVKLEEVAARPTGRGLTPMGPMLYVDGVKKGRANTMNLVAGSGVILAYNYSGGRCDVTISASGGPGGGLSVITVTGTINDTNTDFTAASAPTLVVVNGSTYRHGKGCTISGTSITLDNPVGTGGDIYCLG